MNPRFEDGILDFMDGIPDFMEISIHFRAIHRKVHWRNPKLKSLNSMPVSSHYFIFVDLTRVRLVTMCWVGLFIYRCSQKWFSK